MRKRYILPALVAAIAVAGAAVLHFVVKAHEYCYAPGAFSCPGWAIRHRAAAWQDPVALVALIAGIGIAAALYVAASGWPRRVSSEATERTRTIKLFLASLLIAAGLAGALGLYRHHSTVERCDILAISSCHLVGGALFTAPTKGSWQDPLALIVLFTGIGAGVALAASAAGWPRKTSLEPEPGAEAALEEPVSPSRLRQPRIMRAVNPPASVRLFLAALVLGVALAGALGVHRHSTAVYGGGYLGGHLGIRCSSPPECGYGYPHKSVIVGYRTAAWQDPLALIIMFMGIGIAVALGASAAGWPRRGSHRLGKTRLFLAALVLGVTLGGALELHRHLYYYQAEHAPYYVDGSPPLGSDAAYAPYLETANQRPFWHDWSALVITIVGIGAGGVLVASALGWPRVIPRRRSLRAGAAPG
ncbi:MAG: hypothetical protein ABSC51_07555 [Gaiellaceae bacterium]|jgi:hypothetical protein